MSSPHHQRSKTVSVHKLRRRARRARNVIQAKLDYIDHAEEIVRERIPGPPLPAQERGISRARATTLDLHSLPAWARGVHVEKAGRFQWAVVVTSWRDRT